MRKAMRAMRAMQAMPAIGARCVRDVHAQCLLRTCVHDVHVQCKCNGAHYVHTMLQKQEPATTRVIVTAIVLVLFNVFLSSLTSGLSCLTSISVVLFWRLTVWSLFSLSAWLFICRSCRLHHCVVVDRCSVCRRRKLANLRRNRCFICCLRLMEVYKLTEIISLCSHSLSTCVGLSM